MGKQFEELSEAHQKFIAAQHLFFVGSAARTGKINVSPKGMDSLRILSPNRIIWRNLTGSGNETATHVADSNRMTLMWCSFEKRPEILRVFGTVKAVHKLDNEWDSLDANFQPNFSSRQIFDVSIDMVQSSCGYAVPFMDYVGERDVLSKWAEDKGTEGVEKYWRERNTKSLDGVPTQIVEKNLGHDH